MPKQIQAVATDLHQAILEQPASVRSPITFVFSQRSWLMTLSQRDGGYQVTVSVCLGTVPIAGALAVRRQQLLALLNQGIVEQVAPYCQDGHI